MLTRKQQLSQFLEDHPCSSLFSSEETSEIIAIYTGPCPSASGALRQRYYRLRNKYVVKLSNSINIPYQSQPNLLKIVPKNDCLTSLKLCTAMTVNTLGEIDSLQS